MYYPTHHGWIEVICGPMFSGKSEELIRRLKREVIAGKKVLAVKPSIDDRYSPTEIVSHAGNKLMAYTIISGEQILQLVTEDIDVVGIEEVQFFDDSIIEICKDLARKGKRVVCAGLDLDFRGEPFGPMPQLLAIAEFVDKLTAICTCKMEDGSICGQPASKTQRLINGEPAAYDDPIVLVGAVNEGYQAYCTACHKVKPSKNKVSLLEQVQKTNSIS